MVAIALTLVASDAAARKSGPKRQAPVDMVVIHSTGGPTCDATTGKPRWVAGGTLDGNMRVIEAHPSLGIHYMIDRDGTLRSSVPEDQVAHHVLRHSYSSIAIELINDGDGVDPYHEAQLSSLVQLLQRIVKRYSLTPQAIRRHSDLDHAAMPCDRTQRRKADPGPAFPLERVVERVYGELAGTR